MGDLVPIMCSEVLPGDKINISTEVMLRLAPMVSPMMHRVDAYVHYFFVPNRLVWANWEDFIVAVGSTTPPAAPYINGYTPTVGSLCDYLGLPVGTPLDKVSAIPLAGYQMIYNDYYRDQNLIPEVNYKLVDGGGNSSNAALVQLRKRAWQHDYFTAALPWAQKGDAVTLPVAESFQDVPVYTTPGKSTIMRPTGIASLNPSTFYPVQGRTGATAIDPATIQFPPAAVSGGGNVNAFIDAELSGFKAKTSDLQVQAVTINNLRIAFALQSWLEQAARGGSRYVENLRAKWGVISPDARQQRPEYVGGSRQPISISEVLQMSESSETPQGNMSGHGISVGRGKGSFYKATEHGYFFAIMSVMPKTDYFQGIPRNFSKFDPFDYADPLFANLGEQAILNRELYYTNDDKNDDVFGYLPRFSEYKYMSNRISGHFRNQLDYWHMARKFATRPNLNGNFVTADPTHRVFAVTDPSEHKIYAYINHETRWRRKLPVFGTPSILNA